MSRSLIQSSAEQFALIAVLALFLFQLQAPAQPRPPGSAEGFEVTDYHQPENTKLKSRITGAEAQMQPGGRYLLKQLKIETFRVSGEPEVIIESPECVYDSAKGEANSPGHLQVQSGDKRFSVAGEGFLWQQSQGSLTISNQVRSVVQLAETNAAANQELVITSRWFSFETTNRNAIFHDDVRGDDPEMQFTCGELSVRSETDSHRSEAGSFELIQADQSLVITGKRDGRQATADRGIYFRSDERVDLVGNVTWQLGRESGRADHAIVHRLEKDVIAKGHVAMKLPRESLGAGGTLLGSTNATVTVDTNAPLVDLFANQFHSQSNLTVIEGAVRVVDGTNQLSCDKLIVRSPSADSPEETATAEGNVVVEQAGGALRAARAVYTKSNDMIVFTGEPKWIQGQMEGRAERIVIHTQSGEVRAENEVTVRLQMGGQNASLLTLFPASGATNREPQIIHVFAREFTARERRAIFHGDVRAHQIPITGSEPRLRSDELEVNFAPASNRAESLRAQKNVVYEQGTPGVTNGPATYRRLTTHNLSALSDPATGALSSLIAEGDVQIVQPGSVAQGGRATYAVATDFLELTDHPRLETPQVIITDARSLFWDKTKGRYTGTGLFKIKLKPEAVKQASEKLKSS